MNSLHKNVTLCWILIYFTLHYTAGRWIACSAMYYYSGLGWFIKHSNPDWCWSAVTMDFTHNTCWTRRTLLCIVTKIALCYFPFPQEETEDCCFWYGNMNSKGMFTSNYSVTVIFVMGTVIGRMGCIPILPAHVMFVTESVLVNRPFVPFLSFEKINCISILMNNKIFYFHTLYLAGSWCLFLHNFSIWNKTR